MARPKKTIKTKEPIKLRSRLLRNGSRSLYLDYYHNGQRDYEYLNLYLLPDNAPGAKVQNENTMRAATAIKAKRILGLTNSRAGIEGTGRSKMTLGEFIEAYRQGKEQTAHPRAALSAKWLAAYLDKWHLSKTRLADIDKRFCADLISRLRKTDLNQNTQHKYLTVFGSVLNSAMRAGLIPSNPLRQIPPGDKIPEPDTMREYLTIDEVKRMIATPCKQELIKQAFLFSCFCGLRRSDVGRITWDDLRTDGSGAMCVYIKMQKTKAAISLPLSPDALRWMPERFPNEPGNMPIFGQFSRMGQIVLKKWAKAAGITKNVSFHTARHTFATMLITLGADLYTVSKLLGHTNIKETQIYAKLVDAKKVEAVQLFNGHFGTAPESSAAT